MLTVAPPVRLKQSDFTDEELLSWGHSAEEIAAIRESDDLLLQWRHCPQGLSAIAPFWNVFLSHGLNAILMQYSGTNGHHGWLASWTIYSYSAGAKRTAGSGKG